MAAADVAPHFGAELKDGFKPVNSWVNNGIVWLEDVQQFYRERSAIEKEYSAKLSTLAKKYFEKKNKVVASLSVGDNPVATPGSLECASMTTWTAQLNALESRAAEHQRFSQELVNNLAEPIRILGVKCEELRKQHADYAAKLEKERDASYVDLKKSKTKYDAVCQEVENRRKKVDSAFDMGKNKAQTAFQQQQMDMHNAKNMYLININVTNKQKERYYDQYIPELLDSLQDVAESRVAKLNSLWTHAAQLENVVMTRSSEFMKHLAAEVPRNNPTLDSMMFVRHNTSQWQPPNDFAFEPSPVWLDDNSMATTEPAKVYLRNILSKSKGQMSDLRFDTEKKKREVDQMKRTKQNVREGKDNKEEVEVARALFAVQEEFHNVERQKISAEIEIATIVKVVGDLTVGGRNHEFKTETFKIPTNCDLCGDRLWGLTAKGLVCTDCGYTCHEKCQLKVPADCPGEQSKEEKKRLKVRRQEDAKTVKPVEEPIPDRKASMPVDRSHAPALGRSDTINSMNTLSSGYSATANRSVSQFSTAPAEEYTLQPTPTSAPPPTSAVSPTPAAEPPAATSAPAPAPKPKPAGNRPRILAPPPAAYIKSNGDPPPPKKEEKKARLLYPFAPTAEGELAVSEGQEVVIVEADDGSGWMKVRAGRDEGLIPAAYTEPVESSSSSSAPERPASSYSASSNSQTGSMVGGPTAGSAAFKKKGPAVAPKRGAKKLKHVEAMYDYEARSDAEHSMAEGDRFVLINKDAGNGWADVERNGVVKSVPANYIQEV